MTEAAEAEHPRGELTPDVSETSSPVGAAHECDLRAADAGRARHSAKLGDQAQARIGHSLRSLYDSIVQQPVPDRFRDLIDRLDSQAPKTP